MASREKASHDGGRARKTKSRKRLGRKDYEKHLAKLHVELVKLQEWSSTQKAAARHDRAAEAPEGARLP